jgi:tRNA(Ile)-lysidine synthase
MILSSDGQRGRHPNRQKRASPPVETAIDAPFPRTVEIERLGIGLRFFVCERHQLPRWSEVGQELAYLDLDRLALPLIVRLPRHGDRFRPLGAGGSQKLKKFFIDHRIPKKERGRIPVLSDGKRIVWIVGQRIDDAVKVTSISSRILGVEFFLLETR